MAGNYPPVRPPQQNFYAMPGGYPQQGPWAQGNSQYYTNSPIPPEGGYGMPTQGPAFLGAQSPGGLGTDPLGFAANSIAGQILHQSSASYLQKGQAYVQSKIGLLSGSAVHYHFNVDSTYITSKLLMIVAPFLKRWSWTRSLEQIAGGHKYMPPRQDVNAPDLYIPFMAVFTYCVLSCVAKVGTGTFTPATMMDMAQAAIVAWVIHSFAIKATIARLAAPFVGVWPYRVITGYASMMLAVFMVRSMKRVIFQEARGSRIDSSRHNYVLLVLGLLEFPFVFWLSAVRL
eukprot:jgi/Botrbrau1/392/Bobra.110_2s0047.1